MYSAKFCLLNSNIKNILILIQKMSNFSPRKIAFSNRKAFRHEKLLFRIENFSNLKTKNNDFCFRINLEGTCCDVIMGLDPFESRTIRWWTGSL